MIGMIFNMMFTISHRSFVNLHLFHLNAKYLGNIRRHACFGRNIYLQLFIHGKRTYFKLLQAQQYY